MCLISANAISGARFVQKEEPHVHEWREIEMFPGYSVSNSGLIRNDNTDRMMRQSQNERGIVYVGMMKRGIQYKRSVSLLVAEAFLRVKPHPEFVSTINLDGDRWNNNVANLMWRPRWFATKYFQQFRIGPQGFGRWIEEVTTHELFPTSWDAALKYGLLDREITIAIMHRTYVWPTYQRFRTLE